MAWQNIGCKIISGVIAPRALGRGQHARPREGAEDVWDQRRKKLINDDVTPGRSRARLVGAAASRLMAPPARASRARHRTRNAVGPG